MSLGGCFIEWEHFLEIPERCELDIVLPGEHSSLKLEGITGVVVRSDENGVAVHFDSRLEWFSLVSAYLCNIL